MDSQDSSKNDASKYKSSLLQNMSVIHSELPNYCSGLRLSEIAFLCSVSISLNSKITFVKKNPAYVVQLLGKSNGMIDSILTYLDNYLLYSEGGSQF
jgi:hypothetical protein